MLLVSKKKICATGADFHQDKGGSFHGQQGQTGCSYLEYHTRVAGGAARENPWPKLPSVTQGTPKELMYHE